MHEEQQPHATEAAHTPPAPIPELQLADREQLHASLKPKLKSGSFRNWLDARIQKDGFPEPIRVSDRKCMWSVPAVLAWLEGRPRGGRFDGVPKRPAKGTPFPQRRG